MSTTPHIDHEQRLTDFYKAIDGVKGRAALTPDSDFYVDILQHNPSGDPILQLQQRILLAESESVNLLSGFRGNGKSTELRRLKQLLEQQGCHVVLVDLLDYVLTTKPIELSDFILSLMAALAHEIEQQSGLETLSESYWQRLTNFFESEVKLEGADLGLSTASLGVSLQAKLKSEPSFKRQMQEHLRPHSKRIVEQAQLFIVEIISKLREQHDDPNIKLVLLVDSFEQIRGVGADSQRVHDSVVELFSGQADNLKFPQLHLVYTVPPFLPILAKNMARLLGENPLTFWPNIHVRNQSGAPDVDGLATMRRVITQRCGYWRDYFSEDQLDELAIASGGDLRDFFRLTKESVLSLLIEQTQGSSTTINSSTIERVKQQLLNEMLPVAEQDARWLAQIHLNQDAALPSTDDAPTLARFFDSNLVMNYLNGQPWYDIHPLLIDSPVVKRAIAAQQS